MGTTGVAKKLTCARLSSVKIGREYRYAGFCNFSKSRGDVESRELEELKTALPYDAVPGPKPVPIFGNFWRFLPLIGSYPRDNQIALIKKFKDNYGDIIKLTNIPGKPDILFTCNPKDFEKIYRTEGQWPKRDAMPSYKYYRDHVRKNFFNGIGSMVTEQGQAWHTIRNLANAPMLNPKMTAKYIKPINEVASDFVKRMDKLRGEDKKLPESFNNELNKWALESIALLALDTRVGCFDDVEKSGLKNNDAQRLVDSVITMMKLTYDLDVSPTPMSIFKRRRFNRAVDDQIDISMKYINRCVERVNGGGFRSTDNQSILEHLLTKGNATVACVVAIDMLHAGIDTTATTVRNLLLHLSKNSEAQSRLRRELASVLPEVNSPIRQEEIARLPYLRACIKESLRITPTAIGSLREVGKDIVLSGYKIPKGTAVAMYHVEASNSPHEFPEPQKYLPERWLRDLSGEKADVPSARNANPFSYLPFGFGPRACIGQRFANLEMEILIAKIFRRWNVTYDRDYEFQSKLLYGVATPLTLCLTEV